MSYDFELDMIGDNSNSVILRNIKPHSKIYEFGCAHGRMTKYLAQKLNCHVDICEIDAEAGLMASAFASNYLVGTTHGDFTKSNFEWNKPYYDYVIFADVLEHLINPKKYLEKSKNLLRKDGSIWISIPNIAHNSILIDLWNNKFKYREHGLLDKTHLTFFTRESLLEMVTECGLHIVNQFDLINTVGNTEFDNSYFDIPSSVAYLMQNRPDGEVYQFVWELKP